MSQILVDAILVELLLIESTCRSREVPQFQHALVFVAIVEPRTRAVVKRFFHLETGKPVDEFSGLGKDLSLRAYENYSRVTANRINGEHCPVSF